MAEKTSQKDTTQPKVFTIVVLLIGSLGMLLLTLGCVLDWLKKISLGVGTTFVNALYHPPSGVISIVFFTLLVLFILEKITPGRLGKLLDSINKNTKFL